MRALQELVENEGLDWQAETPAPPRPQSGWPKSSVRIWDWLRIAKMIQAAVGSQFEKEFEGSDVLTIEARLIAIEEVETAGLIAERAEGHGCANGWNVLGGIVLIHFDFEAGAFYGPQAQETPTAYGHISDQIGLHFVPGLQIALEGTEKIGEALEIFVFQDDRPGQ